MRASHEASVNIVVSPLDATRLQAIVPTAALEVVPNGVDAEYWQPGAAEGCGMVFVGTLGWYANRDAVQYLLADIWPALLSTRPRRRLVIVGRDPPAGALAAASDPRIHVTGFVPDIRPSKFYRDMQHCEHRSHRPARELERAV